MLPESCPLENFPFKSLTLQPPPSLPFSHHPSGAPASNLGGLCRSLAARLGRQGSARLSPGSIPENGPAGCPAARPELAQTGCLHNTQRPGFQWVLGTHGRLLVTVGIPTRFCTGKRDAAKNAGRTKPLLVESGVTHHVVRQSSGPLHHLLTLGLHIFLTILLPWFPRHEWAQGRNKFF